MREEHPKYRYWVSTVKIQKKITSSQCSERSSTDPLVKYLDVLLHLKVQATTRKSGEIYQNKQSSLRLWIRYRFVAFVFFTCLRDFGASFTFSKVQHIWANGIIFHQPSHLGILVVFSVAINCKQIHPKKPDLLPMTSNISWNEELWSHGP